MIFMTNNEKIIELIGIFEKAKNKFLKEEKEIIEIDVNERTLSARLMFHLQTLLLNDNLYKETYNFYSVDCEYNRMNKDMKKIIQEDNIVNLIYPDIILHKRNSNDNLIAIEMKKICSNNNEAKNKDRIKLKALTNSKGKNDFHYILGVYFEVDTIGNNNHIIEFFVNGKEYKKAENRK
ncbi:hypothetical protein [Fusobacterium vincentii ATCC 49256]|uniref:Uncharacterized protein n=1 Tax=Fusobacterium vincentii ATCC 49256 TaxID=209882 RepID=Q7P7H6_FUSVC|nr:hypothetical protein [Fusobacterium vincentii ATCC 49256]